MAEIRNEEFQMLTLGSVKSDGTPDISDVLFRFPVPYQQMRIHQTVKVDEADIPGRSGKIKQAVGYDDTEITITIKMVDEEDRGGSVLHSAMDQFKELQAAFRDRSNPVSKNLQSSSSASFAVPTIFSIQSPLTDACGIKTVLFKGLDISDTPGETSLEAEITFNEFEPTATQVERRANESVIKSDATQQAKTVVDNQAENLHDEIVGEEDPLAAAYRAGKTTAMGGTP